MKAYRPVRRKFLFLQGPPGPFFALLAEQLRERGYATHRINFNGGDRADWPGAADDYRGGTAGWPLYFDRYCRDNRITDILLFGDCRPLHQTAHGMAKLRGINIHVFEEGYIRPHWVTMEPDGVNGHSTLTRDPDVLMEQAAGLPPVPPAIPITASFGRRARDTLRYFTWSCLQCWQYPLYRPHRPGFIIVEGIGWLLKFMRERLNRERTARTLARIGSAPYFLFPLQLNSDYQIRTHSPFASMRDATVYVMESFARFAPPESVLVIKEHPLDSGYRSWGALVQRHAKRLGIDGRALHIAGGDLNQMARNSLGMVTVNSTSGTLGLAAQTPVFTMGSAIYDIPGITHQGTLDGFWTAPQPPDPKRYDAFRRVLHARCLVPGGFASQSAIATLIESTLTRLFEDPAHIPLTLDMDREVSGQAASDTFVSARVSSSGA